MIMAFDVPVTQPINVDQWDGYGADRAELMAHIAEHEIENVSFLTGDIHTFFAGQRLGDRAPDGRRARPASLATEFVAGSMTSLGVPETINATTGVPLPPELQALIADTAAPQGEQPALRLLEHRAARLRRRQGDRRQARGRVPLAHDNPGAPGDIETLQAFEVQAGTPEVSSSEPDLRARVTS